MTTATVRTSAVGAAGGWLDRRGVRLGFSAFVIFTGIAGDFWRDALGWYVFGALVVLCFAGSIVLLVHNRARFSVGRLPYPLLAFMGLAVLSIAWSDYRLSTLGGALTLVLTAACGVSIAVVLAWAELLRVLGWVFRAILTLSFVFEFIVSAFIRHPVFPVWVASTDQDHPAKLLYWSRNLLFSGGKIQGILGNSSLLAMAALLALLVFSIQVASRTVSAVWGLFWVAVAVATIAITRSATIFVALAVIAIVLAAALLIRRAETPRARTVTYGGIALVAAAGVVAAVLLRVHLLAALGKSADFTGRIGIWEAVTNLAVQRPAVGWGWIGYWQPWVPPFDHLVRAGGVQVLHAHDAWLDVWLQLGIVGLVFFGLLVLATFVKSWIAATERDVVVSQPGRFTWLSFLPLLMLTAQLVQSIAESRMLIEGGWLLLVLWATKTKLRAGGWTEGEPLLEPGGKAAR